MNRVKSLDDIPLLFVPTTPEEEKGNTMGATFKRTHEKLDKMVQFIWDYQRQHNGETPKMITIGTHVGITNPGVSTSYFIAKLVDEGRINKISPRPFRCTINENHPLNKRAINGFKKLLAAREEAEEAERQRIREQQAAWKQQEDRTAVFEAVEAEQVPASRVHDARPTERPAPLPSVAFAPRTNAAAVVQRTANDVTPVNGEPGDTIFRFNEARAELRDAQKAIKTAMPQMIKVAETRDLLTEIVERGYVVSKR
jgi:hypothetical protein